MNCYDKRGRTALFHAVINDNVEIVNILLNYKFTDKKFHEVKWKDELGNEVSVYAKDP